MGRIKRISIITVITVTINSPMQMQSSRCIATSKVDDALNMYYERMSLNKIRRNFIQQHNDYISDVTALNWVERFSKLAIKEAGKYNPMSAESGVPMKR